MCRWMTCFFGGQAALALALLSMGGDAAHAVDRIKANNAMNLDQAASWTGGVIPGTADVGVWNSTVTGPNAVALGSDQSWSGLRIANPGGAVTINSGNVLTLGAGGIDMSAATQNLNIAAGVTLLGDAKQTWSVGAGRALTISGALVQQAGGGVAFDTSAGGTITVSSGTASSILRYGVVNGTDVAALDATNNVVGVAAVYAYNANPATGAALPNIAGTGASSQNGFDVINLNTNATNAFRLSNNLTINAFGVADASTALSSGVVRFNTEYNDGVNPVIDWTVDLASNRTMTWSDNNPVLIMTANTGASDVIFNGSGHVRANGSGTFWLHQNNPNSHMIFNNTNGFTQSGGAQQLHKDGAGRVILAQDGNSYTGATHIAEGSLQIGNGGTTGNLNAASSVINNASLRFSRSNALTFANNISGTGSVTVANVGTGEVTLSGTNTYTGSTTLEGGFLNLTALDDVGAAAAPLIFNGGGVKHETAIDISTKTTTFGAGGALVNTGGNNVTYAGAVGGGGAGGLTKSGAGILTLGGVNAYAGVNTVNEGTLRVNGSVAGGAAANNGGTIGGTGTIAGTTTINSGGILAPGASVGTLTTGGLTLNAGSVLNFEFGAGVNDRAISTGANGLTINGGAVNLFAENTANAFANPGVFNLLQFAGAIQGTGVSALSVANPETGFNYAFGTSGNNVTLTITTTGTVANWVTNGGGSWNGGPNWSTNPTVPNAVGASARFLTQLGAPATVTLDGGKTVGGVTFASANGYTIAAGSGGTLTFSNSGVTAAQLNATQGSHTISAGSQLTSNLSAQIEAGAQVTMSGAVNGGGGITMAEAGTLVLANAANGYGGGTTINAGTVQFQAAGSLGSGNVTLGGGTLRYATGNTADISTKTVTLATGGGTLDTNGNNVTLANGVGNSGAGGLTKAGAGRLTMSSANTYTGPTAVTGGALAITANDQLGDVATGAGLTLSGGAALETPGGFDLDSDGIGAAARTVALGAGGGVINITDATAPLNVRGVVSGAGSLTKRGVGAVAILAANTYAGGTTVEAGTLTANVAGALGTGDVTLQGTAVLDQGNTALPPTLNVSGTPTLRGGGTTDHAVRAVAGTGTLNIEVTGGIFDFEGDLNGFTGTFNMTNIGGGGGRFFGSNGSNNITFNLTGVGLQNRGGAGQIFLGGLSGDAASGLTGLSNATANPMEYVIGARNETSEFMGIIGDGGSAGPTLITKTGTGTLTLSGANTYTGATRVNQGSLRLAGSATMADTADVFLTAGATLNLDTSSATDLVDSLYLNGESQPVGVYGAIGSGAQFTTPLITGSGFLQVQTFDLPGDFDNDNDVDAADLTVWQGGFATNATGDTDADGDSDGNDFLIWQRNLGRTNPAVGATGAVPEPAMASLAACALAAVAGVARRRRG
jgi:fibronectin-binding autotransporter adhesin